MDILSLLQCLQPELTATAVRRFSRIVQALLSMTGRVTMLGISRWAGPGGSYRTVQRFFSSTLPWAALLWAFFRRHLLRPGEAYLLAGDEVVITKAGSHTYGLDRFFASLYGQPVRGLAFFALSLVSVQERHAFPVRVEQIVRSEAEKAALQAKKQRRATGERRRPGRPKGRKTGSAVRLSPELVRIQALIVAGLKSIAGALALKYLALDGHFGNSKALHMARQCDLHLISKLRQDAALYLPYDGPYTGRGARRKYGPRLDGRQIPERYLQQTRLEGHIQTCIYQAQLLHKEFAQALNVVILVKTNLQTQARAQVLLFSSDLGLPYDTLIDYYSLRFQIEFNFRDAKQYWGLEDFMNVTQTAVTNAANLSLFMVNLSYRLLRDWRQSDPACSLLDLKARWHGYQYVAETIKLLPQKPEPDLLARILNTIAGLGRIHTAHPAFSPL